MIFFIFHGLLIGNERLLHGRCKTLKIHIIDWIEHILSTERLMIVFVCHGRCIRWQIHDEYRCCACNGDASLWNCWFDQIERIEHEYGESNGEWKFASNNNKKENEIKKTSLLPLSMFTSPGNESRIIFVIFELGKFKSWMRSTILLRSFLSFAIKFRALIVLFVSLFVCWNAQHHQHQIKRR